MLEALTLVVPTFNRQRFLDRQVRLWKDTGVQVLLLDGSPAAWSSPARDTMPANVRYWHMPVSIEERLGFALAQLRTPYAALLSDDEIYLPGALAGCVRELAASPDLVACKGLAIGFDMFPQGVGGFPMYPELRGYRLDQGTPTARMDAHMSPYAMATLWAVMKSDVFRRTIAAMAATGKMSSSAVAEIQVGLVTAYSGKCAVIDRLMWLRSLENENVWWESGRARFHRWFRDPAFAGEVERFIEHTVNSISPAAAERASVRAAMLAAAERYAADGDRLDQANDSLARRLIPRRAQLALKRLLIALRLKPPPLYDVYVPIQAVAARMEASGTLVDWDDFWAATAIIEEFHRTRQT